MKYIRTKNGKIYCFTEIDVVGDTIIGYVDEHDKAFYDGGTYIAKEKVIGQADTIEELCDEFVFVNEIEGLPPMTYVIPFNDFEEHQFTEPPLRKKFDYILHRYKEEDLKNIRGAIWTDKGLIYVAKMNEKGELELL